MLGMDKQVNMQGFIEIFIDNSMVLLQEVLE